jgi:hypothetical protein
MPCQCSLWIIGKEKHQEQIHHFQAIYIHAKIDCWIIYPATVLSARWVSHDIKFTIYVKLRIINISEEYHAGHSHMSIERLTTIAAPNDGKNNNTIIQGFLAMP